MLRKFRNIRSGEGRDTWSGFACLFAFIGAHAVLETARDALFLASIPATQLPWMYIAIAVVSLAITQLQERVSARITGRTALSSWALAAAGVTAGFWVALPQLGAAGLYGLYVWSGVLTTLVLVHFWTLMGDLFSVTQAKRLYGVIGAGSVLGAIAGSALAGALSQVVEPRQLVLAAAIGYACAGVLPMFLTGRGDMVGGAGELERGQTSRLQYIVRSPYAARVTILLIVAAAALTLADFLFKQQVARDVDADQLGTYLAGVYLILNIVSLVVQVAVVSFVLRRFDLSAALGLLPLLLVFGALGMVFVPSLAAALLIKGADGSLRYSLNRTATELLFVPLSESARRQIKGFIDVVGQRGGQALASASILGLVALSVDARWIAVLFAVLAVVWLATAVGIRRHYLDLFRKRIGRKRFDYASKFPELDVGSLETLVAALDSPVDEEVVAALALLEAEGRDRLVPGLILYHPSEAVVLAAIDLFSRSGRKGVVSILDRLIDHDSPRIRAASIAARSVLEPNEQMLRMRLSSEDSPEVRATIMVNLIASGAIVGSDARDAIEAVLRTGSSESKISLAEAFARRGVSEMSWALLTLAGDLDPAVRSEAIRAIEATNDLECLPAVVDLLGDEAMRRQARQCLVHFGERGLAALCHSFDSPDTPRLVRWHIPQTIILFEPQDAANALVERLPRERDGMARYRMVRALQRLATTEPNLVFDRDTLDAAIANIIARTYRHLDRELILRRGGVEKPERKTAGYELLEKLLSDKRQHTVDRLFHILDLRFPREDFESILRGLSSANRDARASAVELVESSLPARLRGAVVGLIDDMPDEDRLREGARFHEPLGLDYEGLLHHMLGSDSVTVQDITAFHLSELEIAGAYTDRLEEIRHGRQSADIDRALALAS